MAIPYLPARTVMSWVNAIAKAKLWMDAYTAMYNFFTEHKDKGIKYVHVADNASTAEKFEFDNDPNAPKPKARKRRQ